MNQTNYQLFIQGVANALGEDYVVQEISESKHQISVLGHALSLARTKFKEPDYLIEATLFARNLPLVDGRVVKRITNPSTNKAVEFVTLLKELNGIHISK